MVLLVLKLTIYYSISSEEILNFAKLIKNFDFMLIFSYFYAIF